MTCGPFCCPFAGGFGPGFSIIHKEKRFCAASGYGWNFCVRPGISEGIGLRVVPKGIQAQMVL